MGVRFGGEWMSIVARYLGAMLQSGLENLASYLAAHVLLCLVPAFFIIEVMTALILDENMLFTPEEYAAYMARGE